MNDDYIRDPDNQYNDTLLPSIYNFDEIPKIFIKKNKKGGKKNKNQPSLEPQPDFTEEDIIRISLQEYENEQNKRFEELLEHECRIQDELFNEEQNKLIEELIENEKNKTIDEVIDTNCKMIEHISIFETTKIQLDKLIKIDKNETFYTNILNYINIFESSSNITVLEDVEYEKFLKIIKQIRIPIQERIEIMKIIICRL